MQKRDLHVVRAMTRSLVYQLHAACFEPRKFCPDIVNFERNVMNAFAALGNEFRDRRRLVERSGQFDNTFPDIERCDPYALILDRFVMDLMVAKQRRKERLSRS